MLRRTPWIFALVLVGAAGTLLTSDGIVSAVVTELSEPALAGRELFSANFSDCYGVDGGGTHQGP